MGATKNKTEMKNFTWFSRKSKESLAARLAKVICVHHKLDL